MQATVVQEQLRELRVNGTSNNWSSLYRVAGWAALVVVGSLPIAVYAYLAWPPPTGVSDWFAFIQNNRLAAIINLDLVLLLDQILFVPIILALYIALRRTNEPLVLLGAAGGLIGAVLLMVSREATFSLLPLSDQYTAASTDAERAAILGAGRPFSRPSMAPHSASATSSSVSPAYS